MRFILFWFAAISAHATPVNVTCTTSPFTTSFVIFTQGTHTTIRIIHHNGVGSMPLASRNITPNDLPKLQKKAKALSVLGAQYDIQLDSSNCTIDKQKLIDCHSNIDVKIQGHLLSWVSLDSAKVASISPLYSNTRMQTVMNLSFTMDGEDFDFSQAYDSSKCEEIATTSF